MFEAESQNVREVVNLESSESGVVGEESEAGVGGGVVTEQSEEAAKAALAERRRIAREQRERQAEIERQQQERIRFVRYFLTTFSL